MNIKEKLIKEKFDSQSYGQEKFYIWINGGIDELNDCMNVRHDFNKNPLLVMILALEEK